MKRAIFVVAALVFAACFAPISHMHGQIAVAATPTPAALQYDEINRMAVSPATPPPAGSFPADYQALLAAGNGGGEPGLPEAARKMMQRMKVGALSRYAYYKGWIRTDDPLAQTAVIEKCQEHQYINLDLAKKTYSITMTQPPCPTSMPSMGDMGGGSAQAQPGSVDMTMTGTSKSLGPLTIDGIGTVGSDNTMSMVMANATGSCQNGSFSMATTKYVSQIHVPRAYCPLPRTMSAGGGMAQRNAGCEPRMHFGGSGNLMNDGDRLVMYSLMNVNARMPGGAAVVVERGNVKWFGGPDADALFAIPSDFTKQ